MRIAHIITRMIIGGAQENTLLNCQDLIAQYGDDVLLITGSERGPEGDLLAQVNGTPVPIRYVPSLCRRLHPWHDWRAYHEIRRVLHAFQPDVVHTHSAKAGILGRMAAWSLQVPAIVHTVHGAPFHAYQNVLARMFFQQCERFAAQRCHKFISVANAMTDLLVSANVAPREKFATVYSGMNVEPIIRANEHRQAMRAKLGYTSEQVVIGTIARLFPLKGHADLLEVATSLAKEYPQVRFLWLGDGALRAALEAQIRVAGLQNMIQLAGLVDPAEIPLYLGAMDLLVHTSLREGLARALPQALLAGKPVVSYDIDGAREVCLHGETGLLVKPRNIEALKQSLAQLIEDTALREKFGAAGQLLCSQRFQHETMTAQIRALYAQMLVRES